MIGFVSSVALIKGRFVGATDDQVKVALPFVTRTLDPHDNLIGLVASADNNRRETTMPTKKREIIRTFVDDLRDCTGRKRYDQIKRLRKKSAYIGHLQPTAVDATMNG